MKFRKLMFSIVSVLALQVAQAGQEMVEFSADTVESDMQGGEQTGKLYIGKQSYCIQNSGFSKKSIGITGC